MRSARTDYAGFPEYAGQYRLESVLGSGGMGVVHLATSESGLKLAVKIVHPQHAVDPEFRARFRQEVAAARRVSGAFTAPVVDADPDAERPWMATLFIDAPTLSERVREHVLEARELARLAAGLAEALRDIHRAGVVHRDLKPSNVLMAPDGVRVIDFGISRPADSDLRTETGKLIGTPPFMAPEQFQRPREVGTAADVFALGAVLVYAATGRGPFDSDSHYLVAYQVVHSEPDLTGLPERLVPLVAQCLAKDPAERPSADALIVALRAVAYPTDLDTQAFVPRPRQPMADEEVTHRREQATVPPRDRGRRVKPAVLAAGLGLLLTVGAAGGYLAFGSSARPAERIAAKGTGSPPTATKGATSWSVALVERSASCSWASAALYCSGPGLTAARISPADGSVLWTVRPPVPGTKPTTDSPPSHAAGLVLAVAPGSETLQALDTRTGVERWRQKLPSGTQVVVAGSQVLLVRAAEGRATVVDPASGNVRWTKQIGGPGSIWWSGPEEADQAVLYVATPDKGGSSTRVSAVDPVSGSVSWQIHTTGKLKPVGTARGGLYLLSIEEPAKTSTVVRVDLATRTPRRVKLASPLYEAQATVGPDGVLYVFGATGALAAVGATKEEWRLETGVAVASRPTLADGRVYLSASDGRLLAIDARAGKLLGQTKPRMGSGKDTFAASLPAPVVGDGRVYASAPDGTVFAVAAGDPAGW
ncbi:serine/threonine-protein kinase [Streptomyces sp. NBC_00335]|uniref:serine/threonine-protein kinase n=1 Tax=unclassified Streptomyces TaxID=2593676 RepID=UPI002250C832|nr:MULTISPECIES: serine/threonine-protein kinase [unclassified Streptomyces]MCX5405453.1 serine/threonine-protein kinase [Streptomyces sp. NBC_00086]